MKTLKLHLLQLMFILNLGLYNSCSWASDRKLSTENYIFVGCTPADNLMKSQLGIPLETKIDFISWDLKLDKPNTFVLNINFGESQPNTLGFIAGGQNKTFQGTYTIFKNNGNVFYRFVATQCKLTMIRLNDNLFHILTPQNKFMIGNGGWSYTLNNKNPTKNGSIIPKLATSNDSSKAVQIIYDGRTPCQDFAAEHQMTVSPACFKLKWKLTLNKDSIYHHPTTYSIRKVVNNIPQDITGTWKIIKGTASDPDATIYQLNPDKPNQTISLFVADENILFFLHRDKTMFVGNDNFSFTLNKRIGPDK